MLVFPFWELDSSPIAHTRDSPQRATSVMTTSNLFVISGSMSWSRNMEDSFVITLDTMLNFFETNISKSLPLNIRNHKWICCYTFRSPLQPGLVDISHIFISFQDFFKQYPKAFLSKGLADIPTLPLTPHLLSVSFKELK